MANGRVIEETTITVRKSSTISFVMSTVRRAWDSGAEKVLVHRAGTLSLAKWRTLEGLIEHSNFWEVKSAPSHWIGRVDNFGPWQLTIETDAPSSHTVEASESHPRWRPKPRGIDKIVQFLQRL